MRTTQKAHVRLKRDFLRWKLPRVQQSCPCLCSIITIHSLDNSSLSPYMGLAIAGLSHNQPDNRVALMLKC